MLTRRFSPVQISGCTLWLDASVARSIFQDSTRSALVTANGQPVGGWSDLSSATLHATQSVSSQRYTYGSSGLGTGFPGLISDGTDDVLSTAAVALPAATCFVVGKITTLKQYTGFLKLASTYGNAGSNGIIAYDSGSVFLGNPATSWFAARAYNRPVDGSRILFTQGWGSGFSSIVLRKDRVAITGGGTSGTYAAPTGSLPLHIGVGFSTTVSTATWSEILVYTRQLLQSEIDVVEAYLRSKWSTP